MKMKKIYFLLLVFTSIVWSTSCNDEWKDEQFKQMVSFKAQINSQGVSPIYIRYKPNGEVTFQQPLIVSGSTMNDKDLTVQLAVDPDTLRMLNQERFNTRTELYYKELDTKFYKFPETVHIPVGESTALLPINFSLADIDMVHKWLLPITIVENGGYQINMRKHYRKALLRIFPFNDYSGEYGGTACYVYFKGDNKAMTSPIHMSYVVDEKTVFFYAGLVDEDRLDRAHYKLFFEFTDDVIDLQTKKVNIYTDNPDMKLIVKGTPSYSIDEVMDATRPYLKHVYVTISMEYEYQDYTSIPGYPITYAVSGSMTMERKINTQIPDEDQAIEW